MILYYRLVLSFWISVITLTSYSQSFDSYLEDVFKTKKYQAHIFAISCLKSTPKILEFIPCILPIKHHSIKHNISSRYGNRIHPINGFSSFHKGIDIVPINNNDTIYATATGLIDTVAYDNRLGLYIRLKHSYQYKTLYGHLNKLLIHDIKSIIKQGDAIAIMGSTGSSTGKHLHYSIIYDDKTVDPLKFIELYRNILIKLITKKEELGLFLPHLKVGVS